MINNFWLNRGGQLWLPQWVSGFVLLALLLMTRLSQADLVLEVTQGNDKLTTVAVSPFAWSGNALLPEDLAGIVSNDLTLSGLFTSLPRSNMLSFPSEASEVVYRDWKVLGAAYLVTGRVDKVGQTYTVRFSLFDIVRQHSILSGEVKGVESQLRGVAHAVSDAVYKKITGTEGDFSTRLLYITANMTKPAKEVVKGKETINVPPVFDYQLKYADADGKRVRTIFRSKEPILSPSWSPDGTKVAYVSFESGRSAIYIQDLATGNRRQVTNFEGINSSPAWSPDGKKLALVLSKSGNPEIYILDLAANKLSQITDHFSIDTEPAWVPDGKSIIFTSNRGGSAQIYELGIVTKGSGLYAADGEPHRLTYVGKFNARGKVFPDGKSIALVHKGEASNDFNIGVLNLETGRLRLLTASTLEDSPSIAPGGRRIIYSAPGKEHGELGIVSLDGRVKYRLPSAVGDVREPVWGPSMNPGR